MDIRRLERDRLGPENNWSQRTLPWPTLNAPFEAAWAVIKPNDSSPRHAHHEHEIFIATTGTAVLESAGQRAQFTVGDIVYFPPHTDHQVFNEGDTDFEMYTVWWDVDMTGRFAERDGDNA